MYFLNDVPINHLVDSRATNRVPLDVNLKKLVVLVTILHHDFQLSTILCNTSTLVHVHGVPGYEYK